MNHRTTIERFRDILIAAALVSVVAMLLLFIGLG